jgi:HEXXH motif-containing protein
MAAPLSPPRDLTLPEPGSRTARDVLSRSLGRLLPDLYAVPRALPASPEGRAELEALLAAVRRAAQDPRGIAAILSALRSPTVGALLRSLRNELLRRPFDRDHADGMLIELAATLAFELALAGAIGDPLRLARLPRQILSLSARALVEVPEGAEAITFSAGEARIDRGGSVVTLDLAAIARGEAPHGAMIQRPYHPIEREIVLATADNNPRASFGAEPGEPGNPVDLGGHSEEEWAEMLRKSLALIEEHLPDLRAEIDLYVRAFLPVGWHPETHRSASYRESVGAVYMTLHPSLMTMTEAVIHEFSHNKLHALFELDPAIENDSMARFRSPVRPDPRPLRGVLLAVHAFVPVARLYEKMAEAGHPIAKGKYFPERYAQIRGINRDGAEVVLGHATPTAVGKGLLDEIRRWIDHFG